MSSLDELDIYIPHAVIEIVASLDEEIDQLRAEIERLRDTLRGFAHSDYPHIRIAASIALEQNAAMKEGN